MTDVGHDGTKRLNVTCLALQHILRDLVDSFILNVNFFSNNSFENLSSLQEIVDFLPQLICKQTNWYASDYAPGVYAITPWVPSWSLKL